jgi:hypothetical protein
VSTMTTVLPASFPAVFKQILPTSNIFSYCCRAFSIICCWRQLKHNTPPCGRCGCFFDLVVLNEMPANFLPHDVHCGFFGFFFVYRVTSLPPGTLRFFLISFLERWRGAGMIDTPYFNGFLKLS